MTTTCMNNGIYFLMKELKNRNNSNNHHNNNHHSNNHHNSSHNRKNNNKKKDSVIWTLQAVTIHLEVKKYLHKVGRKIIS
jgi:hypothetical protein